MVRAARGEGGFSMRHGGRILAEALQLHGVRRVFSVPGESFLALLDGLHESGIRNVVCRQEGGAAMMAEAQGKMTGEPGICLVTRGPGATNAAAGVHVARQDSTPLILFIGQIDRGHRDREAFQEVDFRAMFGPLAKWAAEIDDVARIPEYVARAFRVATSGRPGPVVLSLPEDMLSGQAEVPDRAPAGPALAPDLSGGGARGCGGDGAGGKAARRGGRAALVHWGGARSRALRGGAGVACRLRLPAAGLSRQPPPALRGRPQRRHQPAAGHAAGEADALLVLGSRLGDIATGGYTLLDPQAHGKRLIHVHADPDEPGRVWHADLTVTAAAPAFVAALAALPPLDRDRTDWVQAARADFDWWQAPQETPGGLKQERVIRWLSEHLPEDAILTNGAGNFAAFCTATTPTRGSGPNSPPLPAPWATGSRRRWRPRSSTPSGRWSAWRATATSR
jgi:acetolactate synthase-1/2/3 large subunit